MHVNKTCVIEGEMDRTEYNAGSNVSITKFSIAIGSPRAYLSRNRCVITWVSSYRCPIRTFCNNWILVIGYPSDSDARFLKQKIAKEASFAIFGSVFKAYEKRYRRFPSKEVLIRDF